MQNENPKIGEQYQAMLVVWAALLLSQFIFLILIFFTKPELYNFDFSKPFLNDENTIPVAAFAVLAVATFAASFVLEKRFLRQSAATQNTGLVQSALIIGCALCEASSLFGVVLAFAFEFQYFFLWIALGIFGVILHFPRRSNLLIAANKL